jgi:hypothetical protein
MPCCRAPGKKAMLGGKFSGAAGGKIISSLSGRRFS